MSEYKGDCGDLSLWVMDHGIANIISMGFLTK